MEGKARRHIERARALSSGESGLSIGFGGGDKKRKFTECKMDDVFKDSKV